MNVKDIFSDELLTHLGKGNTMDYNEATFFLSHDNKQILIDSNSFSEKFYIKYPSLLEFPHCYEYHGINRGTILLEKSKDLNSSYSILFFKTKELRDNYIESRGKISSRELGELLGYPPSATELFELSIKMLTAKGRNSLDRVAIDYYGLNFVSCKMLLAETKKELFELYGLPMKNIKIQDFISKKSDKRCLNCIKV